MDEWYAGKKFGETAQVAEWGVDTMFVGDVGGVYVVYRTLKALDFACLTKRRFSDKMKEQRAKSKEQRAKSKEQRAKSKEQRAISIILYC
jgi:hypothetical protein